MTSISFRSVLAVPSVVLDEAANLVLLVEVIWSNEMVLEWDESSRKDRSILLELYYFTFIIDVEEFWKGWLEKDLIRQKK